MKYNNIIIDNTVSLPYPFGTHKAFPLDSRLFFSSLDDALEAVHDAVQLTRVGDSMFTLPNEEDGGADSVYYYGEPVAVCSNDGMTADLYLVVKELDDEGEPYGTLRSVCSGLDEEYLRKEDASQYIADYIRENLNSDCIDDYLFTHAKDECGHNVGGDGLYAYGLKEAGGVLQKCDETPKKVLSFDPKTPYDKKVNPLATMNTVRNALNGKVDKKDGYGLSQNDLTDCLFQKLINMPEITIEGDRLTINGKSYKLEEWKEVFDYYIGWINLKRRNHFGLLSKDELLNAVTANGNVPPEGKLQGPDTACGKNTFFVMKRKYIDIDRDFRGEYSELHSNGIESPIRTYIPSVMQHYDIMIDDALYDVYGLHTYRPNPSDKIQIAFNILAYDYYVGWLNLNRKEHFYSLTMNELLNATKSFGNVPEDGTLYGEETFGRYNTFFVMKRRNISIDEPFEGEFSELHSNGVDSPIRTFIPSILRHSEVSLKGIVYDVYGVYTYRPNPYDSIQIAFNKGVYDYYIGWKTLDNREDFYTMSKESFMTDAVYDRLDSGLFSYERRFEDNNLFYMMLREGVNLGMSTLTSGEGAYAIKSPISGRISSVLKRPGITVGGVTYTVYGVHSYRTNETDKVLVTFSK